MIFSLDGGDNRVVLDGLVRAVENESIALVSKHGKRGYIPVDLEEIRRFLVISLFVVINSPIYIKRMVGAKDTRNVPSYSISHSSSVIRKLGQRVRFDI